MKVNFINVHLSIFLVIFSLVCLSSCKDNKDAKPPQLSLKTGTDFVSGDRALPPDTTIKVGINAVKVDGELKTFNVSNAYDGASANTTFSTENLSGADRAGFSRDVTIKIRNKTGVERWVFSVVDVDGEVSKISLNFNIQP